MKRLFTFVTTLLLLLGTPALLSANETTIDKSPEWVEEVYDDFAGDGCPC